MQKSNNQKALVLLSGGLDSATCLLLAKASGFKILALTFLYGQKHKIELEYSKKLSQKAEVDEHIIFPVNMKRIGNSALTDNIEVPKGGADLKDALKIPITYVPARNLIFLSIATAIAEAKKISDIYIGANSLDYSGYPDCRPEFFQAFENTIELATKAGVEGKKIKIHTPLINKTKAEIIKIAHGLSLPFEATWSCYDPGLDKQPCKECDSCILRIKGFQEAGIIDPTY